jgi:hypothetical protein
MSNTEDGLTFPACFATAADVREAIDDAAADDPLMALREMAELLSPYRLDCCAVAEPAAALIHAYDLLTSERRAWCAEAAKRDDLQRFVPDRLEPERRIVIARARGTDE